ncbi:actin cytoskeleton-regulatory complex protein PAN1-like isoform X2 [Amphibalanus amphitrite]|uniref:actin cytoskeleton-regulatory complex protein PAN1-like isoform X2 n=1 Tax=Amphibalanus amphitrite TaxID=1232801 RepID=UPI001C9146F5|nr:actin cytoskeleton-regulatory complex protein PAN1-like isoform X2 [Amphibalanus amphitrite]
MEDSQRCVELLWTAKTEQAYLQVLADETHKQLRIRDDVINTQEDKLQQKHSTPWAAPDELPELCHQLVPAHDFISAAVTRVIARCLTLRMADLTSAKAVAAAADDDDKGTDSGGVSADTAPPRSGPTAQTPGGHGCYSVTAEGPTVSAGLMTTEGRPTRDGESAEAPGSSQDAALAATAGVQTEDTAGPPVPPLVSVETQTAADTLSEQLAQMAEEREEQARLVHHQTELLAQLHNQLARSAAENERLQRHLQLVNALFEQLQRKEAESAAEGAQSPPRDDADETDGAEEDGNGGGGGADLVERVDTAHGRRMVIHVSRTYLRLRDLILEKRSLLSEIDKLRGFNQQLERRLTKQERRLSNVAAELHSTWGLVTKLKIQHAQLHTAESVLRYELREKRKLMSRLRGELEGSRQRSVLASQLNAESELEWRALRRELDQRKRERLVRQARMDSAETGTEPAAAGEDGECRPGAGPMLERSSTDDSQQDGESTESLAEQEAAGLDTSVAESESTESESAGRRTPEPQPTDSVDSAAGAAGPVETSSERRRRLVSLEDQCQQLYTRLVSTTARQVALSSRLAELHAQHGASEAETTPETSVASSEDTAYASLADTPPTPTEAEQLPADRPAAAPPLAAVAAVTAVTAEAMPPVTVAAQRVAVQTDAGPRSLSPLPASQLATETAHRAGGDRALVSAVVALRETPPDAAGRAAAGAEEESDTEGPDNSLDEDADEPEEAHDPEGGGAAACEDEVSRSTADLLEKVGQFLSRTRRGSVPGRSAPAPPPAEPASSDSETDEAAEADRLSGTSAGCKLISLLPSRMVHLRREREQLTEHIARLQAQNERIEQKLARMRTERREQRRRGREDSTAKEHLERRVQQLERQLRLQLAEKYAVTAPPPTEPDRQPSSSSSSQQEGGSLTDATELREPGELLDNFPALQPTDQPDAGSVDLHRADGLLENSSQQGPSTLLSSPTAEIPGPGASFMLLQPDLLPAHHTPLEQSASIIHQPEATEMAADSERPTERQQEAGSQVQEDEATPQTQPSPSQVNITSQSHSDREAQVVVCEETVLRELRTDTASQSCDSTEPRRGRDDVATQTDDVVQPVAITACISTVTESIVTSPVTLDSQTTTGSGPRLPPAGDSTTETEPEPRLPPAGSPVTETEPAPAAGDSTDRQSPEGLPGPAVGDADSPPMAGSAGHRPPNQPLAQLHKQLADARGQLRSVQDDCRRARHALQQMRAPSEYGGAAEVANASGQEAAAVCQSGSAASTAVIAQNSCLCSTPRVTYGEFRRRLSERLHNRPAATRTIRQKSGSIFKRSVKCYMCQSALRPLLARRVTCRACGQLFCRRCACLAVRLPATGEMRFCVHCFYDLSASMASLHPDTTNHETSGTTGGESVDNEGGRAGGQRT